MSSIETISLVKENIMAEPTASTTISRRPTRLYFGGQDAAMEAVILGPADRDSRHATEEKAQGKNQKCFKPPKGLTPSNTLETPTMPLVDFGKDLCGIFSLTFDDLEDHVAKSLEATKDDKSRGEGRPVNFGTVLPGAVYRSSLPMTEDFHFLGTLGLRTVVSLVKREFSPEFLAFMRNHGIRHVVIDMQGTKKVEIPEHVMHSIMEIALDAAHHPLLIHCNHGKHRTGCAVAVIRHVAGWTIDSIVEEYQGFAEPKVRECDVKYIMEYEVSRLSGLFTESTRNRNTVLTSWKMYKYIIGSAVALSFWIITALFWRRY